MGGSRSKHFCLRLVSCDTTFVSIVCFSVLVSVSIVCFSVLASVSIVCFSLRWSANSFAKDACACRHVQYSLCFCIDQQRPSHAKPRNSSAHSQLRKFLLWRRPFIAAFASVLLGVWCVWCAFSTRRCMLTGGPCVKAGFVYACFQHGVARSAYT